MTTLSQSLLRFSARSVRAGCALALALGLQAAMAHHGSHDAGKKNGTASGSERAARPQLGTGAAFAPDGSLWLVRLDEQGRLLLQVAHSAAPADGWRWDAPRRLDTGKDIISADGENHPKLAFGPKGVVLVSYTQVLDVPYTGFIRMLRSGDGGRNFGAPVTVHADRQVITHRFESMAFDAQGALHTVWIDKRDLEAAPRVGGKPQYRGAALYRNVSLDGGVTFGPDIKLADHSCECCRIALAQGADGRVRALWRHVFEPNVRDHAFAVLDAQGGKADIVRATEDGWRIDGCPHQGPALAAAPQGFHAVWFGMRQEGGAQVAGVRYARLDDAGHPDADSLQRIPDAHADHADVQAQGARVAIVWRSTDGMTTRLRAWTSTDGGHHFRLRELDSAEGYNDFPRLVRHGDRMVVVWRTSNKVNIHDIDF